MMDDDPLFGWLLRYSEWLDTQGLVVSEEDSGDQRAHWDLVDAFLVWAQ